MVLLWLLCLYQSTFALSLSSSWSGPHNNVWYLENDCFHHSFSLSLHLFSLNSLFNTHQTCQHQYIDTQNKQFSFMIVNLSATWKNDVPWKCVHALCCPIEISVLLNLLCVCTRLSSSPSPSVTAWYCLFCGNWLHPPLSLSHPTFMSSSSVTAWCCLFSGEWLHCAHHSLSHPTFLSSLHDVSLGQRFVFCSICEEV